MEGITDPPRTDENTTKIFPKVAQTDDPSKASDLVGDYTTLSFFIITLSVTATISFLICKTLK
jgi:preprotein translocase subunit SecD